MAGARSRWLKGNTRYDKKVLPDLLKFNEQKGFRNGARVNRSATGATSNG